MIKLKFNSPFVCSAMVCSIADSLPSSASGTKRNSSRVDEATAEDIKQMMTALSASDWRERYKGCDTLSALCNNNVDAVGNSIVKVQYISDEITNGCISGQSTHLSFKKCHHLIVFNSW